MLPGKTTLTAIEGVRRGLESMKAGQGRPADEVFDELERKRPDLRRPRILLFRSEHVER